MNAKIVSQIMGCTEEQALAQYARNAKDLRTLAAKARTIAPKKYRGATAEQWEAHASRFERLAKGETV